MWGWIKKKVKRVARVVWNFVKGVVSTILQVTKWLVNTLLGIPDLLLTLFGIMPWKKVRVQAVVLLNAKRVPVADREAVQQAVELATAVFATEVKVRLEQPLGHVTLHPEAAPTEVLVVGCDAAILGAQFTGVGGWFRSNQIRRPAGTFLGYGEPVTVFVVSNVLGKMGCAPPGFMADYAVIDPDALQGPEGARLTLAHEVGHACNLFHPFGSGTLAQGDSTGRPRRLARWQKAIFRGSPHVTYW
jgi:hypothetical protein